ncbi:uncharacterized protein Z519_04163 [Cladophialophora bantiana CBS 173.52]|uniref:NAD(P)-binding domain-containing protein n=1 Tax=Cladophialophora bantiana (strain ATCC 10958 / CBS 173.52 / CDC B-1940 / NIH 8579) TaxID=1442370 RepID=A0A0D2HQ72_CLAB1|nr:uncharacterized protein Z519_04163 [Cladophialophora bantiana CBS 173.52]KIW95578.1 hypothetical protein Z519_04163 [Cladophialophora bantiana CBS 173.52]
MSSLTVGIAGISGKFALLLASCLLERDPKVKIKGLARSPSKVPKALSSAQNLELIQGDAFEVDNIRQFVRGCSVIVCCYLGDDHLMIDGQKLLIDIAEEQSVPRYVASDWSTDWTKLEMGALFSKEPCQRIKAYLDTKTAIKGVHILVGGFTDVIFAPFFGIYDPKSFTFSYWGTGDEKWECTTYANSAEYTAAVCLDQSAAGVLRFVGDVKSTLEIAQIFQKVYHIKPKLMSHGSLAELHTKMIEERGKYGADFYKYVFYWYHYFQLSGKSFMGPKYDNEMYPDIIPVTIENYMRQAMPWGLGGASFTWEKRTKEN